MFWPLVVIPGAGVFFLIVLRITIFEVTRLRDPCYLNYDDEHKHLHPCFVDTAGRE